MERTANRPLRAAIRRELMDPPHTDCPWCGAAIPLGVNNPHSNGRGQHIAQSYKEMCKSRLQPTGRALICVCALDAGHRGEHWNGNTRVGLQYVW